MAIQVETVNQDRKHTRWEPTKRWLTAVYEAMSYDPHEHADNLVRGLFRKVEQLEARVKEVEDKKIARLSKARELGQ